MNSAKDFNRLMGELRRDRERRHKEVMKKATVGFIVIAGLIGALILLSIYGP